MACGNNRCEHNWNGECFYEFPEEDYEDFDNPEEECPDYKPPVEEDENTAGLFDRLAVHMTHTFRGLF